MLTFLEKNDLLKLKIIELISNSKDFYSRDSLAIHFSVDKRTINNILSHILNDIILLKENSNIKIEIDKNGFIHCETTNTFNLQNFNLLYLRQNTNFILFQTIFNSKFTTIVNFTSVHYISISTFSNRLGASRKLLSEFNLTLNFKSVKLLIGEEQQIRYFYFYFFWTSYQAIEWPFDDIDFNLIKNMLYEHLTQSYNLSFIEAYKIMMWISITISRVKQGQYIETSNFYTTSNKAYSQPKYFHSLIRMLFIQFGITDEKIIQLESEFLCYYLSMIDFSPSKFYKKMDLAQLDDHKQTNSITYVNQWIKEFCSFFNLSISPQEYHYIYGNLLILFNRSDYFKGPHSNYLKKDRAKFSLYFNKIKAFSEHFELKFGKKAFKNSNEDFLDFLTLIVWEILKQQLPKLHISIQSSFSKLHFDILKQEVSFLTTIPLNIVDTITEETNIVITDIVLPFEFTSNKEVFIWSTFPTKCEFSKLESFLLDTYLLTFLNDHD